ncbi:MAG: hypothetical protein Fur009_4580 [Candidatus Microgenomates bacterium]
MKKTKLLGVFLSLIYKAIDFYDFSKDPFNLFSNYYKKTYGYIPKNINNKFRLIKNYSLKRKYINKNIKLTRKGIEKLKKDYPNYYFEKEKWDKKIRLIVFDIQELNRIKRDCFRKLIKKLGFIMIQKSLWLSPYDQFDLIKKWLKENKIEEKVLLIEAEKINIKNKDKIISSFWQSKN